MTMSSGKHLQDIKNGHIVSLLYKRLTSATDFDDLSIGFIRDRGRRQDELTKNKNIKKTSSKNYAQRCFWICRTPRKSCLRPWIKINLNKKY